ncbi:MAG: PepSY domain-containing protein [Hydrogenophaga sp.]|jgi:uncharacterized membrane protein YkoI|uniref:PepSY domain-containing protein n=1 Tax=Hydrogenophaga sp. TaxID=1904254 RepID=UPI002A36B0F8|nr:PepSY domain-containing protein [Hydrogenophaga sp.]MDX9968020.1 PepSY domain-containing protein [Hydrogenophaga sp.]
MNTLRRPLIVLALAAGATFACPLLQASDRGDHEEARQALERGQVLPLRTVLDQVERSYPGQVLKVEFEHDDGRYIYEIGLLQPDGRMVRLEIDAVDGRVLKFKRKGH